MKAEEVGLGVVVRLTAEGRSRQLWKHHSHSAAKILDAELIDNGGAMCVRLNVDEDRTKRTRVMRLDYLELVT